ncbi:MAG: NDP-sugar synthase [Ramlibacter sp.]|nr:nucleotidyltransferase family protein [Ramlibacter sp.]
MIMAAGRGERMRPLTDHCPKPLLEVRGKPLMQYHVEALARAGFTDVVVNTAWLGEQVEARFGDTLRYSREGRDFGGALETAGGVARALPQLDECFWLVGGDVHVPEFKFSREALEKFASSGKLAHMFLVPNRPHHPRGDFGLGADGLVLREGSPKYTYSTIGLYRKAFFAALPEGNPQGTRAPMLPMMLAAIDQGLLTGELYEGPWADVGTPQRLAELNSQ